MATLLVIDDEPPILDFFKRAFASYPFRILTAGSAAEGLEVLTRERPDALVLDVGLPDMGGLEAFRRIHRQDPRIPVIFATGTTTTGTAIEAMALGAYEYLLKPLDLEPLRRVVSQAVEASRLMRAVPAVAEGEPPAEEGELLVGRCPAMHAVYKAVGRVAPQDVTVLIRGESGTGKELVARAIYHYSRRADKPFLAMNCAAIPETLLESELFGHEQGAFTGATQRRVGKFEQCSGGTLFLDEIGDMPPLTQTKILRVVQDQAFERVGGNETIRTDVRLIAATNRNLEQLMARGQFRPDLYYRINVYAIALPPLRERAEDLPLLARHFLRRFGKELGKEVDRIAPEALELLRRYPWPGNLRELQSALKHALVQATGPVLVPEFLPPALRAPLPAAAPPLANPEALADPDRFVDQRLREGTNDLYAEWLALTERRLFERVLRSTQGNLSQAARILGIHRATLRSRLEALGISPAPPPSEV